jgi:hypothetical protein
MKSRTKLHTLLGQLCLIVSLFFVCACREEEKKPLQCYLSEVSSTYSNIKTLIQYEYDKQFNLVKVGDFTINYDAQGRQLNSASFYPRVDDLGKMCQMYITSYDYTEGEMVIATTARAPYQSGCPISDGGVSKVNLYFKEGKIIREVSEYYNMKDSAVFIYQNGNIIQYSSYRKINNNPYFLSASAKYEYDNKLNPYAIKKLINTGIGAASTYSENNIIKMELKYDYDDRVFITNYTYTYDEKGYPLTCDTGEQKVKFKYLCKQ